MPFKNLLKGYKAFHHEHFAGDGTLYGELVENGQKPETLVIGCCDSRSDPALLTKAQPGELFVVRNVAALVPPYKSDRQHHGTSAAIEFAVRGLKVKHAVVLGHSLCGGVRALALRETLTESYEFIDPWMDIGAEAREAVETELRGETEETRLIALEQALVLVSLNNLMTFPWVAEAVRAGHLQLHGWYFDLRSGSMKNYDHQQGVFVDLPR